MTTQNFDFNHFKSAGEVFMSALVAKLADVGVLVENLKCDHLCFRVSTLDEYHFYKKALAKYGEFLTEAIVNGRAISTFRLHSPFQATCHEVPLVELPAPKSGIFYPTAFEHAEFVIQESFSDIRLKYPHLHFVEGGHAILNPELALKLTEGMQAKFHHLPLDRVIELEKAEAKD